MREPEFAIGSLMKITERPEIVFVKGEGSWLTDHRGKRYLDSSSRAGPSRAWDTARGSSGRPWPPRPAY